MRKYIPVYVRFPFFYAMVFALTEYFIDSGDRPAFLKYPIVPIIHVLLIFIFITVEVILNAVDNVSYQLLTDEAKEKFDIEEAKPFTQTEAYKKWMFKFSALQPIENEKDIELDHDYDGIKELDNGLPPWFTGLFYATILFALVYLVRFHVVGDYTQEEEYIIENTLAEKKVEEYSKNSLPASFLNAFCSSNHLTVSANVLKFRMYILYKKKFSYWYKYHKQSFYRCSFTSYLRV